MGMLTIPDGTVCVYSPRLQPIDNLLRDLLICNNNHRLGPMSLGQIIPHLNQIRSAMSFRVMDHRIRDLVLDGIENTLPKGRLRRLGRPDNLCWTRGVLDMAQTRSDP
ncbi:G1/S-specific cyclin CCN1 [Fusarium oxysporum f. sp. albedinis]|nr:G1/S-specific cyclin CCN1 [Fusarium oxysporum f. sp. albedinis]